MTALADNPSSPGWVNLPVYPGKALYFPFIMTANSDPVDVTVYTFECTYTDAAGVEHDWSLFVNTAQTPAGATAGVDADAVVIDLADDDTVDLTEGSYTLAFRVDPTHAYVYFAGKVVILG